MAYIPWQIPSWQYKEDLSKAEAWKMFYTSLKSRSEVLCRGAAILIAKHLKKRIEKRIKYVNTFTLQPFQQLVEQGWEENVTQTPQCAGVIYTYTGQNIVLEVLLRQKFRHVRLYYRPPLGFSILSCAESVNYRKPLNIYPDTHIIVKRALELDQTFSESLEYLQDQYTKFLAWSKLMSLEQARLGLIEQQILDQNSSSHVTHSLIHTLSDCWLYEYTWDHTYTFRYKIQKRVHTEEELNTLRDFLITQKHLFDLTIEFNQNPELTGQLAFCARNT